MEITREMRIRDSAGNVVFEQTVPCVNGQFIADLGGLELKGQRYHFEWRRPDCEWNEIRSPDPPPAISIPTVSL